MINNSRIGTREKRKFAKILAYLKNQNEFLFKNRWHSGGTVTLDDLNQESFLFLSENFSKVEKDGRVAYLTEANKNRINKMLSDACRNEKFNADLSREGTFVDYSDYIETEDKKAMLNHFLNGCSRTTRKLFELKLSGYDNERIAAKLKITNRKLTRLYKNVVKRFHYVRSV